MVNLLGRIICSSIKNLFEQQQDIFDFTSQTGETEWNLGHHLANEIQKYIFWLNCDLDLTKSHHAYRRPDIVFHKRGIHALNFLVIELKHRGASSEDDIRRIREDWMRSSLNYRFGASINILSRSDYTVIMFHGSTALEFNQASGYIPLRIDLSVEELKATIQEIFTIKRTDPDAYTSSLEHLLDEAVNDIYSN